MGLSVRPVEHDYLGDWAKALKPDFLGRGGGGMFECLLSARSELGEFFWAFGYSANSPLEAREIAVAEMARQRFDQEIGMIIQAGRTEQ